MNKKALWCLFGLFCSGQLWAQHNVGHAQCGTDEHYQEQLRHQPGLEKARQEFEQKLSRYMGSAQRRSGVIIIPVVVHVMHDNGPENISKSQIEDALRVLNEDFRRMHADTVNTRGVFKSRAVDCRIEFRLAKKDPKGRCTEGIVRHQTQLTSNADDNIKLLSTWTADRYYNIWVVRNIAPRGIAQGTVLGYAQFPFSGLYRTDGIIIRHDMMGTTGTAARPVGLPYNAGRVLTHETGHWLGLFHNFQGGCSDGDGVMDTPPSLNPNYNFCSPQNLNSCRNDIPDLPDNYENFMDYANGTCQNMFTKGQAERMWASIAVQRSMLSTPGNLDSTGVFIQTTACAPKAQFSADVRSICTGGRVRFTDLSYQHQGGLSYQWIFPGGIPATSTDPSPQVIYPDPSMNPVTLIVSNANGSDTFTAADFIGVMPSWLSNAISLDEGFEKPLLPANWTLFSGQTDEFRRTGSARNEGRFSLMVNNQIWKRGYRYWMVTDAFDVSGQSAALAFDYAFAQRLVSGSASQDRFSVLYSTDCGQTWTTIWSRSGQQLNTVINTPSLVYDFFPPSSGEWKTGTINLSAVPAARRANVRFRFEFESAGGNHFFLDNLRLSQVASAQNPQSATVSVFPNPAQDHLNVTWANPGESLQLMLTDAAGRSVADWKVNDGGSTFRLDLPEGLNPGWYILTVSGHSGKASVPVKLH